MKRDMSFTVYTEKPDIEAFWGDAILTVNGKKKEITMIVEQPPRLALITDEDYIEEFGDKTKGESTVTIYYDPNKDEPNVEDWADEENVDFKPLSDFNPLKNWI